MEDSKYKGLHPKIIQAVNTTISQANEQGLRVKLFEGYRSPERQKYLFEIGRLMGRGIPGETVTNVDVYESWHQYGLGADISFLTTKNRFIWPEEASKWAILGKIGIANGMQWGGNWKKPDFDHFQMTGNFKSVLEARDVFQKKGIAEVWKRIE